MDKALPSEAISWSTVWPHENDLFVAQRFWSWKYGTIACLGVEALRERDRKEQVCVKRGEKLGGLRVSVKRLLRYADWKIFSSGLGRMRDVRCGERRGLRTETSLHEARPDLGRRRVRQRVVDTICSPSPRCSSSRFNSGSRVCHPRRCAPFHSGRRGVALGLSKFTALACSHKTLALPSRLQRYRHGQPQQQDTCSR